MNLLRQRNCFVIVQVTESSGQMPMRSKLKRKCQRMEYKLNAKDGGPFLSSLCLCSGILPTFRLPLVKQPGQLVKQVSLFLPFQPRPVYPRREPIAIKEGVRTQSHSRPTNEILLWGFKKKRRAASPFLHCSMNQ